MPAHLDLRSKGPVLLLALLCLSISLQRVSLAASPYWTISPGFYFKASDTGGPIEFGSATRTGGWYWSGGYVRFTDFMIVSSGYTWSSFGIRCSGNANVSLTKAEWNEIQFTVNAPSLATSTVRIYTPGKDVPYRVTGASSWSYDEDNDTLTVSSLHLSARPVTVTWGIIEYDFTNYFQGLSLLTVAPILVVASFILVALRGDMDTGYLVTFLGMTVILVITLIVLSNLVITVTE